jgi:hypothetical protein
MPFAQYKDMQDCMNKNDDKENPEAYCATIMKKAEQKEHLLEYYVPIDYVHETSRDKKNFLIKGTAIKETTSRNGVRYLAEELQKAAPTLQGKPILKDHRNETDAIIGTVIESKYDQNEKGILFKGIIMDEKIKEMIGDGRLKHVSIGAKVKRLREAESHDDERIVIAEGIEILELSTTPVPGVEHATLAQALEEKYNRQQQKGTEERIMKDAPKEETIPAKVIIEESKDNNLQKELGAKEQTIQALKEELNKIRAHQKKALMEEVMRKDPRLTEETLAKFDNEALESLNKALGKEVMNEQKEQPTSKGKAFTQAIEEKNTEDHNFIVEGSPGKRSFYRLWDYDKLNRS